jgi:hypothetical protein
MSLLFLCPGTILAPSCRTSCQATFSPPPSSGSVGAASFHPFSRSTTAPTPSYATGSAPSPSESGPETRSSPSAASRLVRPRTPRLAVRVAAAGRHQAGLVFRPAGFCTFLLGTATRRPRNRFPTRRGGFCTPARQAPNAWLVTFPLAIFAQLYPSNFAKIFLPIFTMLLIPGSLPPVVLFLPDSCGAVSPATSPPGPTGVWPASGARFIATHTWPPNPSTSRSDVFLICMLIWWARYSIVIISITFLPSLIAHPSGWKLFPFQIRPRRHAQRL